MELVIDKAIENRSALVGVVGLGYIGLPLVRAFVDAGFQTIGFDVDAQKVELLQHGLSYISHLPADWIGPSVETGAFKPTADLGRLDEPDVIIICVPTPLTESREPDLRFVEATARSIASKLRQGQLVVLESTTYPGTTRDVLLPILSGSGLVVGRDFLLAYSPEREDPGNQEYRTATIPKVVGACDSESLRIADQLYTSVVSSVVPVSSWELAEASKILENTYRAVNIALVNELKKIFTRMGIDIWEVIDAAKTKPFGFQAFYPGPGLGGHCIPIDPFYLSWIARKHKMPTRFIELAGEVNTSMPEYVVERLAHALNAQGKAVQGSKVCVLGVAYKPDVDDSRESPTFELFELLRQRGAIVSYNDPHFPTLPAKRDYDLSPLSSVELTIDYLVSQDCVLIATNHSCYDYDFIVKNSLLVVDTRNATKDVTEGRDKICKA